MTPNAHPHLQTTMRPEKPRREGEDGACQGEIPGICLGRAFTTRLVFPPLPRPDRKFQTVQKGEGTVESSEGGT